MREHPCVEVAFGDAVKAKPRGRKASSKFCCCSGSEVSEPAEHASLGTPKFGQSALDSVILCLHMYD